MVPANPFLALPVPESAPARDRVLTDAELAEVLRAAGVGDTFGRIIRLLATTGQRREEVAGMAWSELSHDLKTWTIPGVRTKNGNDQIVPLAAAAREALAGLERAKGLVLPSSANTAFNGFAKAKARLDAAIAKTRADAATLSGKKAEKMRPWRLHDLRRTVATGLQALGVRLEVTEAVLNHASGSRAGIIGVYQRHDWAAEKCAALDAWGVHLESVLSGKRAVDNVVEMRRPA